MIFMSLANKVGKVCLGLAAGGMCLNPALAQQGSPATVPASTKGQATGRLPEKQVTLAPDGSFRIAVLTRAGFLVPDANVSLVARQKDSGDPWKAVTGTRGLTTVSGLKPGPYHVHVDSSQGTYDGDLMVRSVPVANVSLAPPPLVTFMLAPAQPPDQEEDRERRRGALVLEELEAGEEFAGPGLLFPILGLTAGAAAISLPIALSHHHHHRASP
jgi:hypothetical protein